MKSRSVSGAVCSQRIKLGVNQTLTCAITLSLIQDCDLGGKDRRTKTGAARYSKEFGLRIVELTVAAASFLSATPFLSGATSRYDLA